MNDKNEVLIQVQDLKKAFGKLEVLRGISTEIKKGEVVVVIGPSGSGKSTFLRSLNLLEVPTGGTVLFEGTDITDPKTDIDVHRQKIGMVFQHFHLFPHKTILENIMLAPVTLKKMSKEEAEKKAKELLQHIRTHSTVPIIIVSAKDTDADKTLGLGLGADDYITKPFSVTEVLARIKANIRRSTQYSKPEEQEVLMMGDLTINLTNYTVEKNGTKIDLTAKEFEILKLLVQNPQKVYTKEQMYSLIWNDAYLGDENAVNVHISRLRNKIEEHPRSPKYIITVWGIGYKLGDLS